jgi:hypothetical protein
MTTPAPTPAGSVLDGDSRVLIPLPEAAERLGISRWRRRGDAATALAWLTPISGARCLALAAFVRALPDRQLHELLRGLPRERFDRLVEAAFAPTGSAA